MFKMTLHLVALLDEIKKKLLCRHLYLKKVSIRQRTRAIFQKEWQQSRSKYLQMKIDRRYANEIIENNWKTSKKRGMLNKN